MDMNRGQNFYDHQEMYYNSNPPNFPSWPLDNRTNFPENNLQHQHQHQHQHQPQPQPQHQHQHQPQRYHHHQYDHVNGGPVDMVVGQPAPFSGRKRGFPHSDHTDNGYAKLYVAPVSRTATMEDVSAMFEPHGKIVEIVLPKDKKTGQQQGYCFVKYLTFEEADRAIRALNGHYTFPGELASIKVRYADGERERPVALPAKLYVGHLSKQASRRDVEEIFSQYGHIEDIYIVRDDMKQSRGCGFVQFSRREMALAAIKGLHGILTMRGSEQPLIVRFADPKKPKNGEPRGNHVFGTSAFVPNAQESIRPDNIPSNHVYPMQHTSTNCQPPAVSHWPNQEFAVPSSTQPLHSSHEQPHSDFSQVNLQQMHPPQQSSQLSEQAVKMHKEVHLRHPMSQNLEQHPKPEIIRQESPRTRSNPHADSSVSDAAAVVPQTPQTVASPECDWSEHTCPDGYKYYYNCVTYESRWDKPEEYISFEQQLQNERKLQDSTHEVSGTQDVPLQTLLFHQKLQLQESPKSASESNRLQVQSEASPVIDPTCV